jgi:hypothetical protein
MAYFHKLRDFEKRFDAMSVQELKHWKTYWTEHADQLAPKIQKLALKRVHKIDRAIELKSREKADAS